jgi:hypothetical protein
MSNSNASTNLADLTLLETAGVSANTTLRVVISLGNTTLNTAAQIEDESRTFRFKGALKNRSTVAAIIATDDDPIAAQALYDEINASNKR